MVFQPGPKEEKGQLKLFAGTGAREPFTTAFCVSVPMNSSSA